MADQLKQLKPGQLARVNFSADWCDSCRGYTPLFKEMAQDYRGKFLIIQAEGIKGSEKDWEHYGVISYPTVAFIDFRGKVTFVMDKLNPVGSLAPASMNTEEDRLIFYRKLLNDRNPQARARAAIALGQLGNPASVSLLVEMLKDEDEVARTAAMALSQIGEGTIPILLSKLQDQGQDPEIRYYSAMTLSFFGEKAASAVPIAMKMLDENEPAMRYAAVRLLGTIGNPSLRAVLALISRLEDKKKDLVSETMKTLASLINTSYIQSEIQEKVFFSLLKKVDDADPEISQRALSAFDAIGKKAILYLTHRLYDPEPAVRRSTAEALEKLGHRAAMALPFLKNLLEDSNREVQQAAQKTLQKINASLKVQRELEEIKGLILEEHLGKGWTLSKFRSKNGWETKIAQFKDPETRSELECGLNRNSPTEEKKWACTFSTQVKTGDESLTHTWDLHDGLGKQPDGHYSPRISSSKN